MTELLVLLIAVGALYFGYKIGIDTGRRQVLENFAHRIASALQTRTEFSARYGVRGGYLLVDYLPVGSVSGTSYNSSVDGTFVVVDHEDFERLVSPRIDQSRVDPAEPPAQVAETNNEIEQDLTPAQQFVPSPELSSIIGPAPISRHDATKKVWEYVQDQDLWGEASRVHIKCDERLRALTGEANCTMFALQKHVAKHLT